MRYVSAWTRVPGAASAPHFEKPTRSDTRYFDEKLRPSGLRATQFNIVAEIREAGEATVTQLTRILAMDQTTLTRGLALLERDGLLQTVPKPDGRLKSVQLTRKGEQSLQFAFPLWAQAQEHLVKSIDAEAWALLSGELDRLVRTSK